MMVSSVALAAAFPGCDTAAQHGCWAALAAESRESYTGPVVALLPAKGERKFATIKCRLEGDVLQKYVMNFGGGYFSTLPGGALGGSLLAP